MEAKKIVRTFSLASFLAGLLWDRFGMLVPLYFSFGLTALSVLLLWFVKEKRLAV